MCEAVYRSDSKMRSSYISSLYPQLYNFGSDGNNDVEQMPNLGISMQQVDSIITNLHGISCFSMDSEAFKDVSIPTLGDGISAVTCLQSGLQTFNYDIVSQQQQSLLSHKRSLTQSQMDFHPPSLPLKTKMTSDDFRDTEDQPMSQGNIGDVIRSRKFKKLKKSCQQQFYHHVQVKNISTKIKEPRAQVRRSQKLGDKITTLQKLVSPYGKTDTASVLHEASSYIKLLHEQIKNLFQMLSGSYHSFRALNQQEMTGEEQEDLRSRGLCLVPISFTHKVAMEQLYNSHHNTSSSSTTSHTNIQYLGE